MYLNVYISSYMYKLYSKQLLHVLSQVISEPIEGLQLNETHQALFVLDNASELQGVRCIYSQRLLQHCCVHIIILSKHSELLDPLVKEIKNISNRKCKILEVKTLSTIDSTQRTVYEVFKKHQLSANNEDQRILEKLVKFTSGSPDIVDITIHVLLEFVRKYSDTPSEGLKEFLKAIRLSHSHQILLNSNDNVPDIASVPSTHRDAWESESEYDSWDFTVALLDHCINSPGELLLLRSLAIFGCRPIPLSLVMTMSSFIAQSSGHSHLGGILHERLLEAKLLKKYPLPIVLHPSYTHDSAPTETQFVYVPQHLADHLWTSELVDQLMSITLVFRAMKKLMDLPEKNSVTSHFFLGLVSLLEEKTSLREDWNECYREVYKLYQSIYCKIFNQSITYATNY